MVQWYYLFLFGNFFELFLQKFQFHFLNFHFRFQFFDLIIAISILVFQLINFIQAL